MRQTTGNSICGAPPGPGDQPVGVHVPFEVVDADQRQCPAKREALGDVDADQQRPSQPRPVGDSHRRQVSPVDRRGSQRLPDDRHDAQDVLARGDFGKDAPVLPVELHLRGHHIGQDGLPICDHGGSRLVARRFDSQDAAHGVLSLHSVKDCGPD